MCFGGYFGCGKEDLGYYIGFVDEGIMAKTVKHTA